MTAHAKGFDWTDFFDALAKTVETRQVTWKEVSKATQVSSSTLTRMAQGRQPDAASLAALSAWAGLNPAHYVRTNKKVPTVEPLAQISTLLRADPSLDAASAETLSAILSAAYNRLRNDSKDT